MHPTHAQGDMVSPGSRASRDDAEDNAEPLGPLREQEIPGTEKLACDRCRRRKIKCDRTHPCAHCTKAKVQCTYMIGQKVRPARQRVHISDAYESRMEHISRKIDELAELVDSRLGRTYGDNTILPTQAKLHQSPRPDHPASSSTSLANTPPKHGGQHEDVESLLFSHAIFATRVLKAAIASDPNTAIAAEMALALNTLSAVLQTRSQKSKSPELVPLPRQQRLETRDLPLPPIENIMACLRMAQENVIEIPHPLEIRSLGSFTPYVIKVCSPGPVTESDLIIVHLGLSWLFLECSKAADTAELQKSYSDQSRACERNTEALLANLPFRLPKTTDTVYALYMASIYTLNQSKALEAWEFASRAGLLVQALGLHNNTSMIDDSFEDREWKIRLFWSVYCLEKPLSLRKGVSSTIRDDNITIPEPDVSDGKRVLPLVDGFRYWIGRSRLYGRLYEELYSPAALLQPAHVRSNSGKILASEMSKNMALKAFLSHPSRDEQDIEVARFLSHMNNALDNATLASIYQHIPSSKDQTSTPSSECLSAARTSLEEHTMCLSLLADNEFQSPRFDILIYSGLLVSPFGPFTIIFGNIVKTSDPNDLDLLQRLVSALATSSTSQRLLAFQPQTRIFQALYDVAARYIEVKSDFAMRDILGDSLGLDVDMCFGETFGRGEQGRSSSLFFPDATDMYLDELTRQHKRDIN